MTRPPAAADFAPLHAEDFNRIDEAIQRDGWKHPDALRWLDKRIGKWWPDRGASASAQTPQRANSDTPAAIDTEPQP